MYTVNIFLSFLLCVNFLCLCSSLLSCMCGRNDGNCMWKHTGDINDTSTTRNTWDGYMTINSIEKANKKQINLLYSLCLLWGTVTSCQDGKHYCRYQLISSKNHINGRRRVTLAIIFSISSGGCSIFIVL